MNKRFIIVKSAGTNVGRVKSVHRSFQSAFKQQPLCYYALFTVTDKIKVGDVVDFQQLWSEQKASFK